MRNGKSFINGGWLLFINYELLSPVNSVFAIIQVSSCFCFLFVTFEFKLFRIFAFLVTLMLLACAQKSESCHLLHFVYL